MHAEQPAPRLSIAEFFKRTVIVFLVALAPVLVWFLFDVLLIMLGAILVAVLLRLIAEPWTRWCRLPESLALTLSALIVFGAIGSAVYLFGTQINAEMKDLLARVGAAAASIAATLQKSETGRILLAHMQSGGFSIPNIVGNVFAVSSSLLEAVVVAVIAGLYLAAQPRLYRRGLRNLFPLRWRVSADETIDDIGRGLRLWLLGELIQMALVGALSTLAVWLIGLPSPLALGVIAGVAEFVPYLGPIVAAVPALLVATTQDLHAVLWTAFAYLLIHQAEGNLVAPIITRHMVHIPPAVMLLAIVTILFVFGGVAVIFAAPIAVVVFVAVEKLYLRDCLGEPTRLPGETL